MLLESLYCLVLVTMTIKANDPNDRCIHLQLIHNKLFTFFFNPLAPKEIRAIMKLRGFTNCEIRISQRFCLTLPVYIAVFPFQGTTSILVLQCYYHDAWLKDALLHLSSISWLCNTQTNSNSRYCFITGFSPRNIHT